MSRASSSKPLALNFVYFILNPDPLVSFQSSSPLCRSSHEKMWSWRPTSELNNVSLSNKPLLKVRVSLQVVGRTLILSHWQHSTLVNGSLVNMAKYVKTSNPYHCLTQGPLKVFLNIPMHLLFKNDSAEASQ